MKNNENARLLDHTRSVDRDRRAQAILRSRHQQAQPLTWLQRMAKGV